MSRVCKYTHGSNNVCSYTIFLMSLYGPHQALNRSLVYAQSTITSIPKLTKVNDIFFDEFVAGRYSYVESSFFLSISPFPHSISAHQQWICNYILPTLCTAHLRKLTVVETCKIILSFTSSPLSFHFLPSFINVYIYICNKTWSYWPSYCIFKQHAFTYTIYDILLGTCIWFRCNFIIYLKMVSFLRFAYCLRRIIAKLAHLWQHYAWLRLSGSVALGCV